MPEPDARVPTTDKVQRRARLGSARDRGRRFRRWWREYGDTVLICGAQVLAVLLIISLVAAGLVRL